MTAFAAGLLAAALAVPLPAADKPTPRQKAKELLDSASEMVAAARPDTQPAALFHLADNYQAFDKKKSIEYFKQAFTAAGTTGLMGRLLGTEIVVVLADLDPAEGIALLKQMPAPTDGTYDNRSYAAARIIGALVQKEQFQTAIDLADYMGAAGAYPFEGISILLGKLPPGDERFAAVFSGAFNAYQVKPSTSFGHLVMRYRKELPAGMLQSAVSRMLSNLLSSTDEKPYAPLVLSSSKGTATFTNRQDADLFDIMPLVREVDPRKYEDILSSHVELRSALQLFPGGGTSVTDDRGVTVYTVSGGKTDDPAAQKREMEALNSRQQMEALINARVQAALIAAPKDADKALDLVAEIPSPPKQAEVLAQIARGVGANDSAKARRILGRCISMLDDLKYADDRVTVWDIVAEAAGVVKDDDIARRAIEKLLADAAELYKQDTDKDRPNRGSRENWPSTQAYRHAMIRAAKLMQVDAESLLPRVTDPDLNVLARITLAQALLERPFDRMPAYGRQHPPQLSK
jgi:hypothetical protein